MKKILSWTTPCICGRSKRSNTLTGPNIILALKIAVGTVTVLLACSLAALAAGRYRLHGRINLAFFILTLAAVLGLEMIIRFVDPSTFDYLRDNPVMTIHLCFSVPSVLLMPAMLYTGLTHRRTIHLFLAALFGVAWTGTFITGIFFLQGAFRWKNCQSLPRKLLPHRWNASSRRCCSSAARSAECRPRLRDRSRLDTGAVHGSGRCSEPRLPPARPALPHHPREQGYELGLRPAFRAVRERMFGTTRETRLSQPAQDTLALVAYRQPVTRQEVDSLRGADSLSLLRQLVRLGLISVQRGADPNEMCYGTTTRFLKLYALQGLDDLPRTQDLQRL